MARIEKREGTKGVRWRARVRVQGEERSATFKRRTDAKDWAGEMESRLQKHKHVPTTADMRRTFADLIDRYLAEELPIKRHNRSQKDSKRHLLWWKAQMGRMRLVKLSPDAIGEQRAQLAKGITHSKRPRSPGTCNRYLVSLSHACKVAVSKWRWLDENPCKHIDKLEEPDGIVRILSDDERARLLEACRANENPCLYPIVVLALATGARQGEILHLTWADIDFPGRRILFKQTKNRKPKVVPLGDHAHDVLSEHAKVRRIDTDLVFPGRKPDLPASFRTAWENALAAAKVQNFRFHDLRHSAASYLAMNGATLGEIAEILGHRTLEMVKRYSHFTEQHTAKVVGKMNTEIFGNGR